MAEPTAHERGEALVRVRRAQDEFRAIMARSPRKRADEERLKVLATEIERAEAVLNRAPEPVGAPEASEQAGESTGAAGASDAADATAAES